MEHLHEAQAQRDTTDRLLLEREMQLSHKFDQV